MLLLPLFDFSPIIIVVFVPRGNEPDSCILFQAIFDFIFAVQYVTRSVPVVAAWKRLARSPATAWTLVLTKHATTW